MVAVAVVIRFRTWFDTHAYYIIFTALVIVRIRPLLFTAVRMVSTRTILPLTWFLIDSLGLSVLYRTVSKKPSVVWTTPAVWGFGHIRTWLWLRVFTFILTCSGEFVRLEPVLSLRLAWQYIAVVTWVILVVLRVVVVCWKIIRIIVTLLVVRTTVWFIPLWTDDIVAWFHMYSRISLDGTL